MIVRVERGRIRVHFDDPDDDVWLRQKELLLGSVGSAHEVEKNVREVSCALSTHNLRKLRKLGASASKDSHTRETIVQLRKELDLYEEQSALGDDVKQGVVVFDGYDFKIPPLRHQPVGFQFLHAMENAALFGDCGTGKTFMVLTFADSLVKAGQDWIFLVICPVNLIQHVWIEDAGKFSDLSVVGLRESATMSILAADFDEPTDPELGVRERAALRAERRADPEYKKKAKRRAQARYRKLLDARFAQDADMYVINPENLRTDPKEKRVLDLCRRKRKEGKKVCLIIDESSKLKTRTSRTYKSIKKIRKMAERTIIMSGTPAPNGILDLWAQFDVLDLGKTLQTSYVDYRHDTCKEIVLRGVTWEDKGGNKHNATKWVPRHESPREVYKTIQSRMIRFRTEDCIDLPPRRFLIRDVEMNAQQSEAYSDMENMLFTELEGEPVTAKIAASKLMKLREITGGFIISDDGKEIPLGKDAPKMLELDDLLAQSIADKLGDDGPPTKAIVWAQYKWECRTLIKRYQKRYGARGLYSEVSSGARDEAIRRFKTDPKSRLLVCHPASAGHGLTLVEANYAFYYSMSYNFEEFYQSFRRTARQGQKRAMTYYFLVCPDTIDEELTEAIREKKNLSDLITDGKFSREDILGHREQGRTAQIEMQWEVPDADSADAF